MSQEEAISTLIFICTCFSQAYGNVISDQGILRFPFPYSRPSLLAAVVANPEASESFLVIGLDGAVGVASADRQVMNSQLLVGLPSKEQTTMLHL